MQVARGHNQSFVANIAEDRLPLSRYQEPRPHDDDPIASVGFIRTDLGEGNDDTMERNA